MGFIKAAVIKKVPRLGGKTFEQAAGFLKITNGKNPLDASSVHPESYSVVKDIAAKQVRMWRQLWATVLF